MKGLHAYQRLERSNGVAANEQHLRAKPATESARGQLLEGLAGIETLSVARKPNDHRFLTAFFLAQRVHSFRNRLKSLARNG